MADDYAKGNTVDVGLPMDSPSRRSTSEAFSDNLSGDWNRDRNWWQNNFRTRSYVTDDREFDNYEPAYRFGYESANRYRGQNWTDIEPDLRNDWDKYEAHGNSTWDNVKDSVRDAWDRVTGHR